MKRNTCVFLCFFLLLAGCATREKEKEQSSSYYEIVMQWPGEGSAYSGLSQVEEAVNAITEKEIGARIKLLPSMSTTFDANMMIQKGQKLDLCVSLFGEMPSLIENHYLMELDGLLETQGQRLKQICGVQLLGGSYQDHVYGIPCCFTEGVRYGFLCRTDLLRKYGIYSEEEKLYSFDELEAFFDRVMEGENQKEGEEGKETDEEIEEETEKETEERTEEETEKETEKEAETEKEELYILGGNLVTQYHFMERAEHPMDTLGSDVGTGVLLLDTKEGQEGKIVNYYETEAFAAFATRMYRWNQKGFFLPDTAMSEYSPNALMREQKTIGWFFSNVPGEEIENTLDSGWECSFLPTQEAVRYTDTYQVALWSIPITCQNPEKTMAFLSLLYTDRRVSNLLQRGIEDVSYVVAQKGEEGSEDMTIALPPGETIDTIPYYEYLNVFGNRMDIYDWDPLPLSRKEKLRSFDENVRLSAPSLGYVFNRQTVSAEIDKIQAVERKYLGLIETGVVDPATQLPLFLEELKAAGIEKVIEENQRQYDDWRSRG